MPRRFGLTAREMHQLDVVSIRAGPRLALLSMTRSTPGEACAALYGTVCGPVLVVDAWRHLENVETGTCLAIPVADLLTDGGEPAALAPAGGAAGGAPGGSIATGAPRRLVGLFHSHPHSDAVPSDLDCLTIARLPFVSAIAGPGDQPAGSLRFFTWSTAGVRELPERPPDARPGRAAPGPPDRAGSAG